MHNRNAETVFENKSASYQAKNKFTIILAAMGIMLTVLPCANAAERAGARSLCATITSPNEQKGYIDQLKAIKEKAEQIPLKAGNDSGVGGVGNGQLAATGNLEDWLKMQMKMAQECEGNGATK